MTPLVTIHHVIGDVQCVGEKDWSKHTKNSKETGQASVEDGVDMRSA